MGTYKYISDLWRNKQCMKLLSVVRGYEYTPNRSLSYLTRSSQPAEVCWVDSKAKQLLHKPPCTNQLNGCVNHMSKDVLGAYGIPVIFRRQECTATFQSLYQFRENHGAKTITPFFARSISSRSSDQQGKNTRETKKDISTVDDPFDPLTYNIPEKPVTFAEGASYTVIILAGLGVAAAAGYAVFKELIFEPKEYKIFGKALKRIQDDGQVRVRIGYPITGYGQESRNRAARQRIPSRIWTDEDGVEHVEVNFYIRGPQGNGKVFCEMFKDKVDKQWKFTYLIVEIRSPVQKQMILESYMPAYSPEK